MAKAARKPLALDEQYALFVACTPLRPALSPSTRFARPPPESARARPPTLRRVQVQRVVAEVGRVALALDEQHTLRPRTPLRRPKPARPCPLAYKSGGGGVAWSNV